MVEITTLPSDCSTDDIIEILHKDGAAIVNGFVSNSWLDEFNTSIQTSIYNDWSG